MRLREGLEGGSPQLVEKDDSLRSMHDVPQLLRDAEPILHGIVGMEGEPGERAERNPLREHALDEARRVVERINASAPWRTFSEPDIHTFA